MLPIVLDVTRLRVMVVGEGPATLKRVQMLDAAGATNVVIYALHPTKELASAAESRLRATWPGARDFAAVDVAFMADLPEHMEEGLYHLAKAYGVLVNIEDRLPYCDFHVPSMVRRGDLLVSISTGGQSPALAQMLKAHLGDVFGPEWAEHLAEVAEKRQAWKAEGLGMAEVAANTRALIEEKGWLPSVAGKGKV